MSIVLENINDTDTDKSNEKLCVIYGFVGPAGSDLDRLNFLVNNGVFRHRVHEINSIFDDVSL